MDKYLSIITNFGCHYKCPYCIVKNNGLKIPKSTLQGLDNVLMVIRQNHCNWVSLSGGGDPLYNYVNNQDWYEKLFTIIPEDVKLELQQVILERSHLIIILIELYIIHILLNS